MQPIIISFGEVAFTEIQWLFRIPYDLSVNNDFFYFWTIHSAEDYLITTDGRWMRMMKSEGSDPGDFAVKLTTNSIELKPKQSDRFWYFPPTWKRILNPRVYPESQGKFPLKHLVRHLYKNDLFVPFETLSALEGDLYELFIWDTGLIVLEQDDRNKITVLATEED